MSSHRKVRRSWVATAVMAVVAIALSAGSMAAANSPSAKKAKKDKKAILVIGDRIAEAAYTPMFDPIVGTSRWPVGYERYIYDSLLVRKLNGKYKGSLAESAEIEDPTTINVTLRDGVKFQDGSDLDAEAVKFTIERNKEAKNSATMRQAQLQALESIDVTSPTTLTIHLSKPIAGAFYDLLASNETAPVSQKAVEAGTDLNKEPVGAGPFTLESQTDQKVSLRKWSGYWNAKKVKVAGVDIVNVASSEALVNALTAGAIDYDPQMTGAEYSQLSDSAVKKDIKVPAGAVQTFDFASFTCVKNPDLLGDVRVRQALHYATDKDAINRIVYQGGAEIATQSSKRGAATYDADLAKLYSHDPSMAKKLLADAGKSGATISHYLGTTTLGKQYAEILQQSWEEGGFEVELVQSPDIVQEFYFTGKIHALVNPRQAWYATDFFTTFFVPGVGGTCAPDDATFTADLAAIQGVEPGSAEYVRLYKKLDRYLVENANYIPYVHTSPVLALNKRLGKTSFFQTSQGLYIPYFKGTWVKASN